MTDANRQGLRAADLTRREDEDLIRSHRSGDGRAREVLIERYLPLARRLALRYRRAPEAMEDLFQVASLGLVKAVDRWDPDRGLVFVTYAEPTIRGEIRRYFRDATWGMRPPRPVQQLALALPRARERLTAALGREPTLADLAEHVEATPEVVGEALRAADSRWLRSLDTPVADGSENRTTTGDLIGVDEREYERVEARVEFDKLISLLDHRARRIMRLRFENDLRQSDIAERVGVSQMHVSRIIRDSLETLADAA